MTISEWVLRYVIMRNYHWVMSHIHYGGFDLGYVRF